MTVHLDWPPEIVARLKGEARRHGLSLDVYLLRTVLGEKPTGSTPTYGQNAAQQAREEAGHSILELRKGNILGPEFSIRDLIEEGRRF